MVLTVFLVWSDLRLSKKIIAIVLALSFVGVNYYYDKKSDNINGANEKKSKLAQDSLNYINDSLNSSLSNKADSIKLLELATKDTIKAAIDSSYAHSIRASNEALAKYNLQLQDSLKLIKFNQSEHRLHLAPIDTHEPIFEDSLNGKKVLKIQLQADGAVYNIKLKYFVLPIRRTTETGATIYNKHIVIDSGNIESNSEVADRNITTTYFFPNKLTMHLPEIIIVVKGYYSKDEEGLQPVKIIFGLKYSFIKNEAGTSFKMNWNDFPN